MRMQVILDSRFARPCSAPIGGGKKGEFRDWTIRMVDNAIHRMNHYPADSVVCLVNTYPLDSDLPGG